MKHYHTRQRIIRDIYNLKVDFLYPGNGTVTIKHVYLRKTPFFYSDSLAVGIMIAITVIVLCLWMRKKKFMDMSDRERFFYCIIGSVILLLNYPLLYGYMQYDGSDISYNVARIEAIKNELLSGQFLPQLYTDGLNGQGYIGSLYPSLFLYIPALLRICHVSISVSNQIFMIIINLFTMFTAWFCMKRLTGDRYVALTAMLLYCSMPYRISCMYYRYALGELLAIAFIPLVIAGLYEIVYGNKKKWPILTIGISGIIESHILSTLLIVIFCVLMVLACIARIIKDRRWIYLIMAALSAAVLNMGFIVPFLYYYNSNISSANMAVLDFTSAAVFIPQLFMTFAGKGSLTLGADKGIAGEVTLSLGISGLICTAVGLYYLFFRKNKKDSGRFMSIILMISLLFAFMATTVFPWGAMQKFRSLRSILVMIQFPYRFLIIASAGIVLSGTAAVAFMGVSEKNRKIICALIMATAAFQLILLNDSFLKDTVNIAGKFQPDIANQLNADYTPLSYDPSKFGTEPVSTAQISDYTHNDMVTTFNYRSDEDSYADMPLIMYRGYEAVADDGTVLSISEGPGAMLRISLPKSDAVTGVTLKYVQPWYFMASLIVSAVTAVLLAVYMIFGTGKKGL